MILPFQLNNTRVEIPRRQQIEPAMFTTTNNIIALARVDNAGAARLGALGGAEER